MVDTVPESDRRSPQALSMHGIRSSSALMLAWNGIWTDDDFGDLELQTYWVDGSVGDLLKYETLDSVQTAGGACIVPVPAGGKLITTGELCAFAIRSDGQLCYRTYTDDGSIGGGVKWTAWEVVPNLPPLLF
jgi:hypothetical protein